MSGEAVGSPIGLLGLPIAAVAIGAGAAIAAAVVPGSLAAKAIKAFVDNRVDAAEREIAEARSRIEAWKRFTDGQYADQVSQTKTFQAFARSAEKLAALELHHPMQRPRDQGATAVGFGHDERQSPRTRNAERLLAELSKMLDDIEGDIPAAPDSPYPRLISYKSQLVARARDGGRLTMEEVESFRKTVSATLHDYHDSKRREAQKAEESFARTQALLNEALTQTRLAVTAAERADGDALLENITAALDAQKLLPGWLASVERRLASLKSQIARTIEHTAARTTLAQSVTRNLTEMDYQMIEEFSGTSEHGPMQARLRMPGGEQVKITLQSSGKIGFQLAHETSKEKTDFKEHLPHFRAQEKRWCADLQELFRRLVVEGFSYGVSFERIVPEQSVQLVAIETADDWLAQDEVAKKKRRAAKLTRRIAP